MARDQVSDAAGLLASLESIGIQLWLEDSRLRYRAPKGLMTPERLESLRARRDELIEILRSEAEPAAVVHDPRDRFMPFPVTDVQDAYLRGRSPGYPYGGVGCHGYGELRFTDIDPGRLDAAWNSLIRRHDMLRAVVSADGTQQVLPEPGPYHIGVHDLGMASDGEFAAAVEASRSEMDHRVYEPGKWPLFDLRLTLAGDAAILHFSVDFLIADFVSLQILLGELEAEYGEPGSVTDELEITFRDLQHAIRAGSARAAERDRAYWMERIGTLPDPPGLPVSPAPSASPRFTRLPGRLSGASWSRLRQHARQYGVTPSCAVLAAYAEVLRRWSRQREFTVNVTVLNRPPLHPQIWRVVGDFTSVELLAVRAAGQRPFGERARAMQETLWEDLDHGRCPGTDVMRELSRRRTEGLTLFPVVFTSSIGLGGQNAAGDRGFSRLCYGISQTPQVWLDCQVMEIGDGLAYNWDVRAGIFPGGLAEAMFGAFADLLERLADGAAAWQLPDPVPVPAAQLARRPGRAAATAARHQGLLHDRVLEQAAANPGRPAVICGSRVVRYGELTGIAAAVAAALGEHGSPPGSPVAIEMDKGWEQVAAVIGVLMHGCTYVPVNTGQPVSRRERILADVGAEVVLSQSWLMDAARPARTVVAVDTLSPAARPERVPRDPGDLAYVIYTSGSSGTPKGVMISHGAALNTVSDVNVRFGVHAGDRVLGLASLGFDLSVYDIFGPLSAGGCVVLPEAARRADPAHWANLIDEHQVTIWNSVPAQLEMLMTVLRSSPGHGAASLRLALLSGDWIPVGLPDAARERLPGLRLVSLGGATEASIWSIFHPIGEVDRSLPSIPYGRPLTGQAVEVLDADLLPVPDLVTGEICISGAGLAEGYLGDAEKTARSFVTDPLTGRRLYRTGDLGRYLGDGNIELLGREDSQVKIRGHRVELAEVEAAIAAHPAVRAAAVVPAGERPGPLGLAAFAEPAQCPPGHAVSAAELAPVAVAGAAPLRARVNDEEMLAFARELDSTALLQMLAALTANGLFADGAPHTLDEIFERARVAPRHHRLVRRWLRALRENGLVRQDPADGSYTAAATADATAVAAGWRRVSERLPQIEDRTELISYFRATADHLPELLAGELDPLTLLFPEGRTEIHEVAYNAMFLSRYLNRLLTSAACHLAEQHDAAVPLRVLEVGAGVGGTSAELIPAIASFGADYLFTDVSEFFLNNARVRYASCPWVGYARYDMNRDFRAQGLLPNSYELVVCANVLHYARDAADVLGRLKQLLVPGGWILFIEATRDSYQIMTSMEFLFDESSGDFEDVRRLREQTFLTRGQWLEILDAAGADSVLSLPEADPITDEMGMHFFGARFKSGRSRITAEDLMAHLAEQLPGHMVPSAVQVVDALPLTGNGKVDRKELAAWLAAGRPDQPAGDGDPPCGDVEERIAAVFERVLRVPQVGRHQAFFQLGGDSLLAAQLAAEIRETVPEASAVGYDDLLRLILDNATVAVVAAQLAMAEPDRLPAESGSPVVRLGDGPGLTVLVHDGTGTLAAYGPLAEALDGKTGLIGLLMSDRDAYLGTAADALIDQIAAVYTKALLSDGADQLRLVGHGFGGILAAELARQLGEAGLAVTGLTVIAAAPPPWPAADEQLAERLFWRELGAGEPPGPRLREERFAALAGLAPESRLEETYEVFQHSMRAAAAHLLLPYAGDITLIRPVPGSWWPSLPQDMAAYWSDVCLGDLDIVDLARDDAGFIRTAAPVLPDLIAGRHAR